MVSRGEQHIKTILDRLLEVTREGERASGKNMRCQELGSPASRTQLAALEQYWGRRLPPSYRGVLRSHAGMRLWLDIRLLSIQEIIEGAPEMRVFEGPRAEQWKWIFARGIESHDALAFDPSQVEDDGEMAVVHVSENGERERWTSLGGFLEELLGRLLSTDCERTGPTYYLWTSLWVTWPSGTSFHSRGFVPGHDGGTIYPGQKRLFDRTLEAFSNPLLSKAQQAQVDLRFEQTIKNLGSTKSALAIVLTDASAYEVASFYYIYYEPCADLVIALNPTEKRTVLYADGHVWDALRLEITAFIERAEQLLRQSRIIDALVLSIDEACGFLRLSKERVR